MTRPTPLPSPFRVLPLARLGKGGRWRTEAMRSYGAPVLLWFTRGQGRITVNGVTAGYGPHNAIFLPAGTMHGFEMSNQVHGSIVVFPAGVEDDLSLPEDPVHLRLREADKHSELSRLIENLQREMENGSPMADTAMMCHAGLLSVWIEREIRDTDLAEPRLDASGRLAAAFTALVEQEFHSAKSVRDYASELGVTPTHLSRVCNRACGRPASAILADRVHYEARRLLSETHLPIKDIAKSLGFASPAYFTRAFHNHTGRTPSEFRRNA
ncbi:AraC family transcriptional regulator [Aliiroseovarius subalbicans]|uniref:helix-turn-helix transcriptional regulator n=1 Tax=Aliiroseovarius subalbicans TaxID=2925840 RepID=UPI001F55F87C|nr:AraC family transcriptional regulator [Aliiroseovarius subalbicans]MCI2398361.1 AraC family transcriptional regulator [Aliiroseovarius subalbicans]